MKRKEQIDEACARCWEFMQCKDKDCPAYGSTDIRCWLQSGTHCRDEIQGDWLEKMEVCLDCDVFKQNMTEDDWQETLRVISKQFQTYHGQIAEKEKTLSESNKKLLEFKRTSIYLLKELDQKSKEVEEERSKLEERVQQKTEELNHIHAKLVQSTKLAALGRFSAGIAHEINNPLGAIINYSRSLAANPGIEGQNRGYLELILKGLFRIEYIVKEILRFSGGQKSEPQPTDLNHLIEDIVHFLKHKLDQKGIVCECVLTGEPTIAAVDPIQMQQVFSNVINNAVDAVNENGQIQILTSVEKDNVHMVFKDNGRGMKKESLEKVFDPFYTTKEVGQGTGLGLFISYNILQIYNGDIRIDSKINKGTQVHIILPLMDGE